LKIRIRHRVMDPPQIIVTQLHRGRRLEAGELESHRIEPAEHVAHQTILAGRVAPLEHDQQGTLPFGEERRLQLEEPGAHPVEPVA